VALLRWIGVFALLLLLMGFGVLAETHEQLASKTGLAPDLFSELTVTVNGTDLGIFLVAVDQRAFDSRVSPALRQTLGPYVGQNALYVNATVKEVVSSFPFDPDRLTVTQDGKPAFVPVPSDWVEITPGFLEGRFTENPAGTSYGSGSEGVLIMGDHIDITEPFTVSYAGQQTGFALRPQTAADVQTGSSVAPSHPPVSIPTVSGVSDLQDTLTHGEFSAERVAGLLGIPQGLLGTITLTNAGQELRLLCIRLEPALRGSGLSPDLLSAVDPLIGTGAVMVWALSPTGAPFVPWNFYIQQSGTNYVFFSDASFVELTKGFLHVGQIAPGEIVAGVIRLPNGVDPRASFSLRYGTSGVTFAPSTP